MTISGFLNGKKVKILLDTGSSVSLIGGKILDSIVDQRDGEAEEFDKIIAVNSTEMQVAGMIQGKLKIGQFETQTKLNILPEASYEVLLGRDFLCKHVKIIDFMTKEILFRDNSNVRGSNGAETKL